SRRHPLGRAWHRHREGALHELGAVARSDRLAAPPEAALGSAEPAQPRKDLSLITADTMVSAGGGQSVPRQSEPNRTRRNVMSNPIAYAELHTKNATAAKAFYSELFDWKLTDHQMPGGLYTEISA